MSALLENFQSCGMCYKAGSAAVKMLAVSCPPASYFLVWTMHVLFSVQMQASPKATRSAASAFRLGSMNNIPLLHYSRCVVPDIYITNGA